MTRDTFFNRLAPILPDGEIISVHVGLYWTAVIAEVDDETRCGLAATGGDESHHYITEPAIPRAGCLIDITAHDLAKFIYSDSLPEVSVGLASVNALLPRIHLALVRPAMLRSDMHQVFAEAKDSNYLVFITGPSRTADIELTTTLGVHGPKELFVWILEG